MKKHSLNCFIFTFLLFSHIYGQDSTFPNGRILEVNRKGGTPYRSIAAAVKDVKPGDTIRLAQGSGPYREIVQIGVSGSADKPITFDGNGETVTGFETLSFTQKDGVWTSDVGELIKKFPHVQGFKKEGDMWVCAHSPRAFPSVLVFNGHRVFQDAATGDFPPYAKLSSDGKTLTLGSGVSPDGWEIASRQAVFVILNVSNQTYKNTKASGSLNDGYNLHGTGDNLVFENVEGFQNIDEGFSAHDKISCTVRNGRFWENENGLCNVETCSMTASGIETFSNSGWGFALRACKGDLSDIKSWDNGIRQIAFLSAQATCQNVVAINPSFRKRKWITSQESKNATPVETYFASPDSIISGGVSVK